MKNFKPSLTRLTIAVYFFALVLLIGLLSIREPVYKYEMNPEEAMEVALSYDDEIIPEEVSEIVYYEDSGYVIIDCRSPYDFERGHIDGAVNIPSYSFFEDDNLDVFETEDSTIFILYGKDQLQATGPYLILRQMGYENLKVLLGGYDYYSTHSLDYYDMPEDPEYYVETPKYNFAEIMMEMGGDAQVVQDADQPEVVIPTRKKKESVIEGGC